MFSAPLHTTPVPPRFSSRPYLPPPRALLFPLCVRYAWSEAQVRVLDKDSRAVLTESHGLEVDSLTHMALWCREE